MYIISDTNTNSISEGDDYLVPPIPELPTCELPCESILEKRVLELEKKIAEQDATISDLIAKLYCPNR